jgi:S-adenosylhomocysteine hydrolase
LGTSDRLGNGAIVTLQLVITDHYVMFTDPTQTGVQAEHFELVEMTPLEAQEHADCVFIVTNMSRSGYNLQLASTAEYVQFSTQHMVDTRRWFVKTCRSMENTLVKVVAEQHLIRLVAPTGHHMVALDVEGHANPVLGAVSLVNNGTKGLFKVTVIGNKPHNDGASTEYELYFLS